MRLVIAEKPSLGRAIAQALPGSFAPVRSGSGAKAGVAGMRGGNTLVTWAFGHILEMVPPEAYSERYKRWRIEDLPILVKPDDWRLAQTAPDQIKFIATHLREAREVVHAGDPDREGQLLIDEILIYLGWRGPVLRLLPHATDDESLRKAWAKLEPNERYRPLYEAALCRQRADWLVGMNASRAATLCRSSANQVVPVGRVMTPTLALVVSRDRQIEDFKSQTFWKVVAQVQAPNGVTFELTHDPEPHCFDQAQAQALMKRINGREHVLRVSIEKGVERAPLPWHLGDFQRAMQKMCGLSLQNALEVLQFLYEKRLVSYPRTSCRYLPQEQKADAVGILAQVLDSALGPMTHGAEQIAVLQGLRTRWAPKDYIYDNAKVAEHHGLTPTRQKADGSLTGVQAMAYAAVVRHFARTLLPHHQYEQTVISFEVAQENGPPAVFTLKGRRSLNWHQSWRALDACPRDAVMPGVADGQRVMVTGARLETGQTTPPQRYTEATLSADMEAIAKYVKDERVRARLKESSGIGTAATRSSIIDKLKQRGMLALSAPRASKAKAGASDAAKGAKVSDLISTAFGREVVDAMPRSLTDPSITAAWEDALDGVAQGKLGADEFMARVDTMVSRLVTQLADPTGSRISSIGAAQGAGSSKAASKTTSTGTRAKSASGATRAASRTVGPKKRT